MNSISTQIQVDFRSTEPLFLQIARQIEELVRRGELQVGDQLPTVRELATELRINFNTVARSYRLLDDARLISTQRGRGTFIWEAPPDHVAEELRLQSLHAIARKYLADALDMGYSPEQALQALSQQIHPQDGIKATKEA